MSLRDFYERIIDKYKLTLEVPKQEEVGELEERMESAGITTDEAESRIEESMGIFQKMYDKPSIDDQCLIYATSMLCKKLYHKK